jgi:nucleoside-diphosphate-sugar epimerase
VSTLIVGCGYLGERVGRYLVERGERVIGTVRSAARAGKVSHLGIQPLIADVAQPETLDSLPRVERILYCVGFDRSAGIDRRAVSIDGLKAFLDRVPRAVRRIVYASSTSVYGQTQGQWVSEDSPANPVQESGKICKEAEETLRIWGEHAGGFRVVLRFSGLYGPGRVIGQEVLKRGEPIPGNSTGFLNLVHIEDAARAAVAALDREDPDSLFLVSDDRPVERREFYALTARLLNVPPPRFEPPRPDDSDSTNRRIANRKLREVLGVDLAYPDITTGVPAALGLPVA